MYGTDNIETIQGRTKKTIELTGDMLLYMDKIDFNTPKNREVIEFLMYRFVMDSSYDLPDDNNWGAFFQATKLNPVYDHYLKVKTANNLRTKRT